MCAGCGSGGCLCLFPAGVFFKCVWRLCPGVRLFFAGELLCRCVGGLGSLGLPVWLGRGLVLFLVMACARMPCFRAQLAAVVCVEYGVGVHRAGGRVGVGAAVPEVLP